MTWARCRRTDYWNNKLGEIARSYRCVELPKGVKYSIRPYHRRLSRRQTHRWGDRVSRRTISESKHHSARIEYYRDTDYRSCLRAVNTYFPRISINRWWSGRHRWFWTSVDDVIMYIQAWLHIYKPVLDYLHPLVASSLAIQVGCLRQPLFLQYAYFPSSELSEMAIRKCQSAKAACQ